MCKRITTSPFLRGCSVLDSAHLGVLLGLRRLEDFAVGAVLTHDDHLPTHRVRIFARDDSDDVDARTKRNRSLERHALRVLAVAVRAIEDLPAADEDVGI